MKLFRWPLLAVAALGLMGARLPPLGIEGASCAPDEKGPAVRVNVLGLKDDHGLLRLELYPAEDGAFLANDRVLIAQGKVFRRVVEPALRPIRCRCASARQSLAATPWR